MRRRILVLHSGGMDSTVCLYSAHKAGDEVVSLGIDYGQRLRVEMMFAEKHCAALGVRRDVVQVNWKKPEREIPLNRHVAQMKTSVSPAFLPGRNLSFLALATAHAAGIQADEVQIGLNCVDFSGYPDCTVEFFDAFKATLAIADPSLVISAPLLKLSKRQIADKARSLGLGEWDTWSCYRPQLKEGGVTPCNECDACRLHAHAWQKE